MYVIYNKLGVTREHSFKIITHEDLCTDHWVLEIFFQCLLCARYYCRYFVAINEQKDKKVLPSCIQHSGG